MHVFRTPVLNQAFSCAITRELIESTMIGSHFSYWVTHGCIIIKSAKIADVYSSYSCFHHVMQVGIPDSKIHGAKMGPTWVLSAPDGPYVGNMNLTMRDVMWLPSVRTTPYFLYNCGLLTQATPFMTCNPSSMYGLTRADTGLTNVPMARKPTPQNRGHFPPNRLASMPKGIWNGI